MLRVRWVATGTMVAIALLGGTTAVPAQVNTIRRAVDTRDRSNAARRNLNDVVEATTGEEVTTVGQDAQLPSLPLPQSAGSGGSGSASGFDFSAPDVDTSATVSPPTAAAIARWHVRHNVCTGDWSTAEFNTVFVEIDGRMVDQTCTP